MNSNNHPSAYGYQPPHRKGDYPQPARLPEVLLKELYVQVEHKLFALELKQNERGRFLRVTEEVGGWVNTIIIPDAGLQEMHQALGEMLAASGSLPPPPA